MTLVAAFAVLLIVAIVGLSRTTLARKASSEGIEEPEAVKAYDRISRTPQFALIRRMFVRELKKHEPKGTIVDVGCGPGYLIEEIAREIPQAHVIGVDISQEMLTTASKNLSFLGLGQRAEFRKGEAQSLPFENESIEYVVSTLSLHHWSDPSRAFQEIYRVLKPKGQFLIFDVRRDPRRLFYWLIVTATRVTPLFLGTQALRRINEPLGSLLASYTAVESMVLLSTQPFARASLKGGLGWLFLCGQK